eukprot:gene13796-19708_t
MQTPILLDKVANNIFNSPRATPSTQFPAFNSRVNFEFMWAGREVREEAKEIFRDEARDEAMKGAREEMHHEEGGPRMKESLFAIVARRRRDGKGNNRKQRLLRAYEELLPRDAPPP